MKNLLSSLVMAVFITACSGFGQQEEIPQKFEVEKTEAEWKTQLTPEQYEVTRKRGTERAYSGKYQNNQQHGLYHCVCCNQELFSSNTKFEASTGWPTFWSPVARGNVLIVLDDRESTSRNEVLCKKCGAHLGHVFDDGPKPTGERYSINSAALSFQKD